nr:MAG TPA: hypothetical protein [Caudoviricetes sp.]
MILNLLYFGNCYLLQKHKRSKRTTSACSSKAPKVLLIAPNALYLLLN